MKYIKGTFVCLACWPAGDQNLTKEKVTLGKIYFSRTLTKPHKSRMGAAAAQRVQAYMKRKEGKLLKLFDLILLKQFGHLCRKMTPIKFACNYSCSGGFSDKNCFQILFFLCPRKNIWLIKQTANTHLIKFLPKVSMGFRAAFAPKTFCRGFQMFLPKLGPNIAVTPTVNTVINALSD